MTQALGKVMTDHQDADPYYARAVYRIVWGVFGLLLACLGVFVLFFGVVAPLARIGVGSVMTLLGIDAMWSSVKSKPSWLAGIIPFI